MDEADRLCSRVAIIDSGKIIAVDKSENLKSMLGGDIIVFETSDAEKVKALAEKMPWFKSATLHDGFITMNVFDAEKNVAEIMAVTCREGIQIKSIKIHKPTLEDVFLHYTGKIIRTEEADVKDRMRMVRRMRERR
jgi:ABC-2 type transport system ATP-binding protein